MCSVLLNKVVAVLKVDGGSLILFDDGKEVFVPYIPLTALRRMCNGRV